MQKNGQKCVRQKKHGPYPTVSKKPDPFSSITQLISLSLSLSLSHTHTHTQTHEFLSSNLWLLFNLLGFLPSTPSLLQNPLSFHPQTSTNPIHSNHSSSHPPQTNPMLNLQNPFHQIHQKQLQNQNQLLLTQ